MKDRDYFWCLVHTLLDREEELERLCPACRAEAEEARCPGCGRPAAQWGEGAVNSAFDPKRFEQLRGGGAE
jgi:predicted amidophosphoribosyltransferase